MVMLIDMIQVMLLQIQIQLIKAAGECTPSKWYPKQHIKIYMYSEYTDHADGNLSTNVPLCCMLSDM